jgi:hypothetical protein
MIKSRDDLKNAFRSGAIPTASDFSNLIDSFAQVDDLASLSKQVDDVDTRTGAIEQKVQMPATREVDADGGWQLLKSGVDSLCAFEILAQIEKTKTSPYSAVTHAIAISGATRTRPSVRQTQSFSEEYWPWILGVLIVILAIGALPVLATTLKIPLAGVPLLSSAVDWVANVFPIGVAIGVILLSLVGILISLSLRDRRAITVGWQSSGKWFDPNSTVDLVIRSGCDYGSKTQKIQINCQIKRLWN